MSFEFTVYGDVRFDVSYSDDELNVFIIEYIQSRTKEGYFTYLKLCRSLIETAVKENRLVGAKSNTYYQSPQLKPNQYTRISRLLWRLILQEKIFIDFYNNEYVAHFPNDTTFGINNDVIL